MGNSQGMIARIRVSGGLSACFLLWVMSGEASGDSAASIFQMPFDELLALQVVTPSKFAENLRHHPMSYPSLRPARSSCSVGETWVRFLSTCPPGRSAVSAQHTSCEVGEAADRLRKGEALRTTDDL